MEAKSLRTSLEEYEPESILSLEDYLPYIGLDRADEIRWLAEPLAGRSLSHANSTFQGGGAAEMLRSIVPLARSIGLDTRWFDISGHDEFFRVTRKFHNLLQGHGLHNEQAS